MKLHRRRLLKASLAAVALATTQSIGEKSSVAKSGGVEFPDLKLSKLLMQCCLLAASQSTFLAQKSVDLTVDQASIQHSKRGTDILDRHTLIALFQAQVPHFYEPQFHGVAIKDSDRAAVYGNGNLQNCGGVLRSPYHNIIVLHATQSDAEWLQYASAPQTDFDLHQPHRGQVHSQVKQRCAVLKSQIQAVIQQINPTLPCYVTGYSLGGAIAHLAAAEIALSHPQLRDKIQVYSFGAPQLGDRPFTAFYDALLPQTYRIVNLADRIPALASKFDYHSVGQIWTYLKQQGDMQLNHAIETYERGINETA